MLLPSIQRLNERQQQLFFLFQAVLAGHKPEGLVRLLAKSLGVAPSALTLLQGAAGRLKTFRIEGDPVTLAATLERAIEQGAKQK